MAVTQISKIQTRRGLQENLPQLAEAELGWSIDQRKLYIGNGTLANGAPTVGNTEILTEFSNVLDLSDSYTYKGTDAGYTVVTGVPTVTRPIQTKLDDFVSAKDFGATGDGSTDDTDAINLALYELFCREVNPEIRRSLFFPAGIYLVSDTILIPPYAKIWGEGMNSSIIKLDNGGGASSSYLARTTDSLQQTGISIGTNGAVTPKNIEIGSLTFQSAETTTIFLVESIDQAQFDAVGFIGPMTTSELNSSSSDAACVRINGTASNVPRAVTFDKCAFIGMAYGIQTAAQCQGFTVSNSKFDTLFQGVVLGPTPVDGGPVGFRVIHNLFDNIYSKGIVYDEVEKNISAYNIFLDVGTSFDGGNGTAATPIIYFNANNNISIGDMFERGDTESLTYARVEIGTTTSIGFEGTHAIKLGRYVREVGTTGTLTNNVPNTALFTVDTDDISAWSVDYTITRGTGIRHGRMLVTNGESDGSSTTLSYADEYTENDSIGVTLIPSQVGTTTTLKYTTLNYGTASTISYSLTHLA